MVVHELWYQHIYSCRGILDALSDLAVNMKFISFDEVLQKGIEKDIDVIPNVGEQKLAANVYVKGRGLIYSGASVPRPVLGGWQERGKMTLSGGYLIVLPNNNRKIVKGE